MNDSQRSLCPDPDDAPRSSEPARLPVRTLNDERASLPSTERRSTALSLDLREPETPQDESDLLDLRRLWVIVVKRRWTVLAFLTIVVAAVVTSTLLMTPIYRSTAILQIERDAMKVVDVEGVAPTNPMGDGFYETQYELLRSRALAMRVAKDLNLRDSPVVQRMRAPTGLARIKAWWSGTKPAPPAAAASGGQDPDKVYAGLVAGHLQVEPVRNSRLVRVHFNSPDPRFSATVANGIADAFIRVSLERRVDASSYAKTYLEERLQTLRLKLEDAERELIGYSQREQIVSVDERKTLAEENLTALNSALAESERERIGLESRWQQLRTLGAGALPLVLADPTVQALKQRRAELSSQYQQKLATFKPAYPAMQQLRNEIDELDRQLNREVGTQRSAVEAEYRAAVAKEKLLRERFEQLKAEVLDLQGRSIQYNILKRDLDTNRELYAGLLQRYKEIGVVGGVGTNNVSIVDRAEPGWKFAPDLSKNVYLALLFGLVGGIALALLLEYLDDSIKTPEDVENRLRMPILGIVPLLKSGTPLTALSEARSAFAESYRSVRTALQFSTSEGVPKVLFITSPAPTEGKTTTAYALATNFAQLGKRVLLIDADLRNPSMHKLFGQRPGSKGLSNYLAREAKASEIINAAQTRGLLFVSTGPLPPNPAELLAGPRMASLLDLAGEKFDQVIIDGPPVLGLADAMILSNIATGTLLVIGSGATRVGYARGSIKRLLAARSHLLGVVLTKFEARKTGAGYGYGYGYGYGDYGYYGYGADKQKRLSSA
jgi:capsular exopolysaccharide synthesis family protein